MIDSITNDTISLISQIDNFDKQNYANTYKLLNEEKKRNIESIFKVLSFIYPKDIITQAKVNYLSSSKNFQALAIEILDNIIDNQIKQKIITILENIDKTQKILDTFKKPNTIIKSHQYINSLITNQFSQMTLRMALIYEIGKNKDTKYLDCLKQTLKKENKPLVIETLNWSLLQFEQKRIHTLL